MLVFSSLLLVRAVVLCQGALVFLFPGLSLQGGCLALELAAGTTREPLLGDCSALVQGFQHGARSCGDGVGREQGRQEAGRDLTFVERFATVFVTFIQILRVWNKHTFGDELSF